MKLETMKSNCYLPRLNAAKLSGLFLSLLLCAAGAVPAETTTPQAASEPQWSVVTATGKFSGRDECSFIECGGLFYLIGGRGLSPVDIFDPKTNAWKQGSRPPMEIHHFQPVVWQNRIYVPCAMTGGFPKETPVDHILIYDPAKNEWSNGGEIPPEFRRGSTGAAVYQDQLYLVCGIINGHLDGWVSWLSRYDLKTGKWSALPEAPHARDHFGVAEIGGKIYAVGGRRSKGSQPLALTVPEVDVYDIQKGTWETLPPSSSLPTQRAGGSTVAVGNKLIVLGGESVRQRESHAEVEVLDTATGTWRKLPPNIQGRHGTGTICFENKLYTCAGVSQCGGGPMVRTLECLPLP